jgi:hypothetical protein
VKHSSRFSQNALLYILLLFIATLVGACNHSLNTPEPVISNPQPASDNNVLPPVVIPESSTTPSKVLLPTPSPEYTPSVDRPDCFDNMKILATFGGVAIDDAGILNAWPGEEYYLGWRIQNTGMCVWDSAYSLERVNNIQIAGFAESEPDVLKERLPPGKSVVVEFKITAPLFPGDYPVSWGLVNGYRVNVGPRLEVIIRVSGDSSNSPLPTMTRNPNVQFEASSMQVAPYEKVVLSWEVKQANAVYFYTTGQAWVPNQVPLKGVRIFYPTNNTAFNLRVVSLTNTVESYKIEVRIEPPSGLPGIVFFEVSPQVHLAYGSCVDITWKVRGGMATDVRLFVNDSLLVKDADNVGEYTDCPTQIGLKVYTLVARGPAGTVSKSIVIKVQP